MAEWKNLDTLKAYKTLMESDHRVDIKKALSGDAGAERVKKYSVPMACGMTFNYAARPVDEKVLDMLRALAKESDLEGKFKELYNGAMINTGEKRLVLHHLTRGQLGDAVIADVRKFTDGAEQSDDITMLCVRYLGSESQQQ